MSSRTALLRTRRHPRQHTRQIACFHFFPSLCPCLILFSFGFNSEATFCGLPNCSALFFIFKCRRTGSSFLPVCRFCYAVPVFFCFGCSSNILCFAFFLFCVDSLVPGCAPAHLITRTDKVSAKKEAFRPAAAQHFSNPLIFSIATGAHFLSLSADMCKKPLFAQLQRRVACLSAGPSIVSSFTDQQAISVFFSGPMPRRLAIAQRQ